MSLPRPDRRLWLLLAVSYGLRIWLACRGGQDFWPDEGRYGSSRNAIAELRQGQWPVAAQELLGHADHMLFRWFGLLPAAFEAIAGEHPAVVASYFGLFSVLALYLIWAVALRGAARDGQAAGPEEAWWAAFFAACSTSLFYYARHFFPYDIALCAMLGALWLGMGRGSWRASLGVGIVAGLGFLSYNGYWWLGGCVLILHTLLGDGGSRRLVGRGLAAGAGLLLPILAATALGALLGHNLVAEGSQWGALVRGDFPYGHRVIAGYLWSGEGGLLLLWLAGLAYALARPGRERPAGRLGWYAGGLALVVGGLIFLSDVLPVFRIQGRQVREAVPFLCLGAAVGFAAFIRDRGRTERAWRRGLAVVAAVGAAWNFSVPLRQVFPDGFLRLAAAAAARQPGYFAYRLAYVEGLWGVRLGEPLPPYPTILQRPHPMQFRPYQYEGWDRAQRADIDRHDVAMRLIGLPGRLDADPRWRGYPGPVRFLVCFPVGAEGFSDPLITTGRTGRGDLLYLHYVDAGHVSFGLDHWGVGGASSAPVPVDYSRPHEILVFAGFLLPPAEGPADDRAASLQRRKLLVLLDGRLVFSAAESFYQVPRGTISFAVNLIGGSTARASFEGEVREFGSAPPAALASALAVLSAGEAPLAFARARPASWHGAVGPVRLRLTLPGPGAADVQPLLSAGEGATAGLVFLRREDASHLRIGFAEAGRPDLLSPPLPVSPAATQQIDVALGSLLPDGEGGPFAADANLLALRGRILVRLNGREALDVRRRLVSAGGRVGFGVNLVESGWSVPAYQGGLVAVDPLEPSALPVLGPLADVVAPAAGWGGYPGPVRLKFVLPAGAAGQDPLLVAGIAGAADFLYVRYLDGSHIQLGLDHWGGRGQLSAPIPVAPRAEQELVVSLGSLMPPAGTAVYRSDPALARLRTALYVTLNGQVVIRTTAACYEASPEQLLVGANPLGGSTASPHFQGRVISVARVPAAEILAAVDADPRP